MGGRGGSGLENSRTKITRVTGREERSGGMREFIHGEEPDDVSEAAWHGSSAHVSLSIHDIRE